MFLGFIYVSSGNTIHRPKTGAVINKPSATIAEEKRAVEERIAQEKSAFANGYDIFIIDLDTKKVVATASLPTPSLEWKDVS